MDFEYKLRLIAMDIYLKVINYVQEHMEDDNIYYNYAFLKLNKDLQVLFNYTDGGVKITLNTEDEFKMHINWIIFIRDYETKYSSNDISYDSSLRKEVEENGNESYNATRRYEEQQKLTEEEKESILNYYKFINEELQKLEYDKKRTQQISNFTIDAYDAYSSYMNDKEFKKLKESNEEVLPVVKIAVDWWVNILSGEEKGGSLGPDIESKFNSALFNMFYQSEPLTEEHIATFKKSLTKRLMEALLEADGEVIQMECDYGLCRIVYEAMKDANINPLRTPSKTNMYMCSYYLGVKEGFGAKTKDLYYDEDETDFEEAKKRYREIKNIQITKK